MGSLTLWLLFVVVPALDGAMTSVALLACLITFAAAIATSAASEERDGEVDYKAVKRVCVIGCSVCLLCILLVVLLPNFDQMLMLIGVDYITDIEGVSELPANLVEYLNDRLEVVNNETSQE